MYTDIQSHSGRQKFSSFLCFVLRFFFGWIVFCFANFICLCVCKRLLFLLDQFGIMVTHRSKQNTKIYIYEKKKNGEKREKKTENLILVLFKAMKIEYLYIKIVRFFSLNFFSYTLKRNMLTKKTGQIWFYFYYNVN